jgi:hypothetical protein
MTEVEQFRDAIRSAGLEPPEVLKPMESYRLKCQVMGSGLLIIKFVFVSSLGVYGSTVTDRISRGVLSRYLP